jgi:hypothetical protein
MSNLIVEFENVISDFFCDDIIEYFESNTVDEIKLEIPKNHIELHRIEKTLFKKLNGCISDYKKKLLNLNTDKSNEIINLLVNGVYTKNFTINKVVKNLEKKYCDSLHKSFNRYNVLNFVFYLNELKEDCELEFELQKENETVNIIPKKCKLVLFPEDLEYEYKLKNPKNENLYIIYGQLCNNIFI